MLPSVPLTLRIWPILELRLALDDHFFGSNQLWGPFELGDLLLLDLFRKLQRLTWRSILAGGPKGCRMISAGVWRSRHAILRFISSSANGRLDSLKFNCLDSATANLHYHLMVKLHESQHGPASNFMTQNARH